MRWVIGAALLGFASSALLSSILHLPRDLFVALHAVAVVVFIAASVRIEGIDPRVQVRRRWVGGLVAGALVGAWALLWDGAPYGVIDALNVFPVLALYGARPADELRNRRARWRGGLSALLASIAITAAYHVGFTEFRGPALIAPLIGTAFITRRYLAAGSPMAAVLSHVVMPGASVCHGMATTVQLPPH